MRRFFISILTLLLFGGASPSLGQEYIKYISEANGCISLQVTAYGKKSIEAIERAEKLAIEQLLFRGIPDSETFNHPLIDTREDEILTTHTDYFERLFQENRYKGFVVSSTIVSKLAKDITKRKSLTINLTINVKTFKRDLENYCIIRKFGL